MEAVNRDESLKILLLQASYFKLIFILFEILYSLQAKLTCHSFTDAGRRYRTPASETKDIISSNSNSQSIEHLLVLVPHTPFS